MIDDDASVELLLKRYRPAGPPAQLKDRIFHSQVTRRRPPWPALAASVLMVVGAGLSAWVLVGPGRSHRDTITAAQIERTVRRAGEAAQLLAVADFWADQPGGESHAQNTYHEIVHAYPDVDVATQARSRLAPLSERGVAQ